MEKVVGDLWGGWKEICFIGALTIVAVKCNGGLL
jgi:hypothetical protein